MSGRLRTVPNTLTVVRLWCAPCVALAFLVLPRPLADWTALILFVGASATDWLDGALARRWQVTSRFGAMLDPIADKAMVAISLATVLALSGLDPWIAAPAVAILFREIFVSGLREYLGAASARLSVTRLAKWKTTAQMVALALLFLHFGLEERQYWVFRAMDVDTIAARLAAGPTDFNGPWRLAMSVTATGLAGVGLLWIAALMTVVSGIDYYRKARQWLGEETP